MATGHLNVERPPPAMEKFCPQCGAETEHLVGPRGVCRDCYSESHSPLDIPDEVTFPQCSHCMDYRIGNTWKEYEGDEEMVLGLLKQYEDEDIDVAVSYRRQGEKLIANLLIREFVDGELIESTTEVTLRPEQTQCPKCSRFHGGYYEAILQLRGGVTESSFGELMDRATAITNEDRNNFIANVEERDGGYDIYCSTDSMANSLVTILRDEYSIDVERSREIVGADDGEEVYRQVIAVHLGGGPDDG